MGIGGSLFLLALGAILAFAVDANLGFLNVHVVGWVLMLAGVVGLILTVSFWHNRRRAVVTEVPVEERRVATPAQTDRVVEEYREVRRPGRPV